MNELSRAPHEQQNKIRRRKECYISRTFSISVINIYILGYRINFSPLVSQHGLHLSTAILLTWQMQGVHTVRYKHNVQCYIHFCYNILLIFLIHFYLQYFNFSKHFSNFMFLTKCLNKQFYFSVWFYFLYTSRQQMFWKLAKIIKVLFDYSSCLSYLDK